MKQILIAGNRLIKINIIPSTGKDIIEVIHFGDLSEIDLQVIEVNDFKIIYRQIDSEHEFDSM